jgi:HTH-type transcriptional regulator/antitoxin HigA
MEATIMSRVSVGKGHFDQAYMKLLREQPLRPLRTKTDYRRATAIIDRLVTAEEGSLSRGEQDYLETLVLLIEDYDRRHRPDNVEPDPIAILRHLMEASEMTVSELGLILGSKGNASEILSGKRSLSKSHIAKLAQRFAVDAGLFFPRLKQDPGQSRVEV